MNTDNVTLVVCLTLFIVVGINAALYVALRRGKEASLVELTRRAVHRLRDPWKDEDEALQELSKLVSKFKQEIQEKPGEDTSGDRQDQQIG
ncbi:MAG: hypothetical protein A2Z45_09625 [Chloroflexi bacterium RBG_19FT_COMBO_55_16]|nr:MAG: hypothetical protein A2Z45_09625 [Chloroflexi bacterium RBG_19FT_COMBO_55_16]